MASLAVSADASGGLPRMTKELLLASCLENDGYETPELNDNLYLHFKGFQRIENLEPYTGLKGLWLEANGLCQVEGLGHLGELRCLFLGRNLLRTVHGLDGLRNLVTLDLSENRIAVLSHLGAATPRLETLNVNKNELADAASIGELARLGELKNLQIEQNALAGDDVIAALAAAPKLCGVNVSGNPCVSATPQFRKRCLLAMPLLAYLDRPVFEGEREAAAAWAEGGHEAEQRCKRDFAQAKRDKDKRQMAEYRAWQAKVRAEYQERKGMGGHDARGAAREAREAADRDAALAVERRAQADADRAACANLHTLGTLLEGAARSTTGPSSGQRAPPARRGGGRGAGGGGGAAAAAAAGRGRQDARARRRTPAGPAEGELAERVHESLHLYKLQKEAKKQADADRRAQVEADKVAIAAANGAGAGRPKAAAPPDADVESPPREKRLYWTEAMDTSLAGLVRAHYYDFDAVAEALRPLDIDFGLVDRAKVDGDACRDRWNDLDVANWDAPPGGLAGVRLSHAGGHDDYAGARIPSFEELQRKAASLGPRYSVPAASLPCVGDFDDADDDDDLKIFDRKTDFGELD
ncbi:axoneme assembly protein [Aureococcus anophagefferens]|uniref:Axoneme assembly protein n=1 Tax=Aureococcus anophagefferens TaxID=44056 RepID=A0ABR1GDY7_AURAN